MFYATHIYLLAALLFFALWLLLFLFTPRSRWKEMVTISLLTMILGYFAQQMHLTDWWQPNFVFNIPITIEDTLFGFSIGGIVYAIYRILCRCLLTKPRFLFSLHTKIFLFCMSTIALFGLFYVLHVHSFWSSIIALSIPLITVGIYNRNFFLPIFLTGLIVTTIAFIGYLFALYLNPQFVTETYLLTQLSGIFVLGIPVEELIWFFFASTGGAAAFSIVIPKN